MFKNTGPRNTPNAISLTSGQRNINVTALGNVSSTISRSSYEKDIKNTEPRNIPRAIYSKKELKNKSFRGNRKIEPIESQTETPFIRTKLRISGAFLPILRFGAFIGLSVSQYLSPERSRLVNTLAKIWIVSGTTIYTICCVVICLYIPILFKSNANRVSYSAHCLSGFTVMWIYQLRPRKVIRSLKRIAHVASSFHSYAEDMKQVKRDFLFAFIETPTIVICLAIFFFNDEWDTCIENMKDWVPFQEGSLLYALYIRFVLITAIYSIGMSTLVQLFTMTLSGQAYRCLSILISAFENQLTNDIDKGSVRAPNINEYIYLYKKISSCVADTDKTFGISSFIIHINVFFIVFGSASIFLTEDYRLRTFLVSFFGTFILTLAFGLLINVANSGEKVMVNHQSLKTKLIEVSGSLYKQSPEVSTLVMFDLLSNEIKGGNLHVSLIDLFDIRTRFVLSFLGSLISYIVTLYQLGFMHNS